MHLSHHVKTANFTLMLDVVREYAPPCSLMNLYLRLAKKHHPDLCTCQTYPSAYTITPAATLIVSVRCSIFNSVLTLRKSES